MSKSPRRRCGPLAPLLALPDLSRMHQLSTFWESRALPHLPAAAPTLPLPGMPSLHQPNSFFEIRFPDVLFQPGHGGHRQPLSHRSRLPQGRWQSSWCKCRVNLITVPSGETGQDSLTPNLAIWSPLAPALTSLPVPAAQEKATGHTPLPSTAPTAPLSLGQSGSKDLLLSKSRV